MVDEYRKDINDARAIGKMFVLSGDTQCEGIYEIYCDGKIVETSRWIPTKQCFESLDPREWF